MNVKANGVLKLELLIAKKLALYATPPAGTLRTDIGSH
jgi:hypothetical protein